jgi:hypothetical protein
MAEGSRTFSISAVEPRKFHGNDDEDPQTFIEQFEALRDIRGWSDSTVLQYAVTFLEGDASRWYQGERHKVGSFTDLRTGLIGFFASTTSVSNAMTLFLKTIRDGQQRDETCRKFICRVMPMARRANLDEGAAVRATKEALLRPIASALALFDFVEWTTLVQAATKVEMAGASKDSVREEARGPAEETPRPQPMDIGVAGHKALVTCFFCKKKGHMKGECRRLKQALASKQGQPAINVAEDSYLLTCEVGVDGQRLRAVVDTGASSSIIRSCFAREGGRREPSPPVRLANGQIHPTSGWARRLPVTVGGRRLKVNAICCDTLAFDMLTGADTLADDAWNIRADSAILEQVELNSFNHSCS